MAQEQTITKIAIFQKKEIRRIFHKGEWCFSVIDVIKILSGTDRPRKYWSDLKKKLVKEGFLEVSEKIGHLKMQAPDGKMRETDCVTTETMFRIIQAIPSSKAEPFKRWLARVGYKRVGRGGIPPAESSQFRSDIFKQTLQINYPALQTTRGNFISGTKGEEFIDRAEEMLVAAIVIGRLTMPATAATI